MVVSRHDYAFPFRIDAGSGQAQRTDYESHVMQLVKQVLLTSPGERTDLPEFGCGLRAVVFAGNSDALSATVEMLVYQALKRWLADHLTVRKVEVLAPEEGSPEENQLVVNVEYVLVTTHADQRIEVRIV